MKTIVLKSQNMFAEHSRTREQRGRTWFFSTVEVFGRINCWCFGDPVNGRRDEPGSSSLVHSRWPPRGQRRSGGFATVGVFRSLRFRKLPGWWRGKAFSCECVSAHLRRLRRFVVVGVAWTSFALHGLGGTRSCSGARRMARPSLPPRCGAGRG